MDPEKRPHRAAYLDILCRTTLEKRLTKAFELRYVGCKGMWDGLRPQHPTLSVGAVTSPAESNNEPT